MMRYRWTASFGMFLGGVTTLLTAGMALGPAAFDRKLSETVWFISSQLGVAISLISLFLHSDQPDRESLLNHRAVGFIAVALNSWPWVLFVLGLWVLGLSGP